MGQSEHQHHSERQAALKREAMTCLVVLLSASTLISSLVWTSRREMPRKTRSPIAEQSEWIAPLPTTRPIEMTLQQLADFEFDRQLGGEIPERIKQLEGSTVQLRGYILPVTNEPGPFKRFALATTPFSPEEGNETFPQQTVIAICPPGQAIGYCPGVVVVEGRLHLHTTTVDGDTVSLYQLFARTVKLAPSQSP